MSDIKQLMKERMAASKAKTQQNIAMIKALKTATAPVSQAAPPAAKAMPPPKPKVAPDSASAQNKDALPAGFFDATSGHASTSEPAPANSRPLVTKAAVPPPQDKQQQPSGGSVDLGLAYGSSDEDDESEDDNDSQMKPSGADAAASTLPAAKAVNELPEGFFDDKAKDAKAHNKPPPKQLDMDEMMAEFEKEIEPVVEALDKFEDEEVKKLVEKREKEEKEEQEDLELRVKQLREAKMSLLEKRKVEAVGGAVKKRKVPFYEDDDDDDEDDADDLLDWRRKAV